MSKIFISHSSKDNLEATAIRDWLEQEGWDEIFLDIDPKRGIAAFERWENKLYEAADRCEAVLFLVSQSWLTSKWCIKELELADKLGKRLLGVIIEDLSQHNLTKYDLPDILQKWQLVELYKGKDHKTFQVTVPKTHEKGEVSFSQAMLLRIKYGLENAGLDPNFFAWPPEDNLSRSPYPGLAAMGAKDAGIFFGRDGEIIQALERLDKMRSGIAPRMLVILGASGSGKSSFMKAGVLPRLARDDRNFYPLPVIRPETRVLAHEKTGFLKSLQTAFDKNDLNLSKTDIAKAVEGGAEALQPLLRQLIVKVTPSADENKELAPPTLILPIDQGEELFQGANGSDTQNFLDLLAELMREDNPAIIVLVTIRSDNYEYLQMTSQLEDIQQQTMSLPPMPTGNFERVITGPALRVEGVKLASGERRKLDIDAKLVDALLKDIEKGGNKDALPLLAFTLERLYDEKGKNDGDLTLQEYEDFGRIKGAIEQSVENALAKADKIATIPKDKKKRLALLRAGLIPWLAGINPETREPQRRVIALSQIPEDSRPLMTSLVNQRLLSTDENKLTGKKTIEPAHEALLRQWPALKHWLDEDKEDLIILEGIKKAAQDWQDNNKDDNWLIHTKARLQSAEGVRDREDFKGNLDVGGEAYLRKARKVENAKKEAKAERQRQELETQKKATRRGWIAAGIGIAAAVAMAIFSVEMYGQWQEGLVTQSQFLAEKSQQVSKNGNATTAMLIALEGLPDLKDKFLSVEHHRPYVPEVRAVLDIGWRTGGIEIVTSIKHEKRIERAVFSPDGQYILTASFDETAKIWDKEGKLLTTLSGTNGHRRILTNAVFSPDGKYILTSSHDKTVKLWDKSGSFIKTLGGHKGSIWDGGSVKSTAFRSDGQRILTAISYDNTAKLWDADGNFIKTLSGHSQEVLSAIFSPDKQYILTSSKDMTAKLWDASGNFIKTLSGHTGRVSNLAFSPDSQYILTSSWDGTVKLWDSNGVLINTMSGHKGSLTSAIFSTDGQRILSASANSIVILWDKEGNSLKRMSGTSAVFSPDGRNILTISGKTAKIWNWEGHLISVLSGHKGSITSAVFSPDGKKILTASADNKAKLWWNGQSKPFAIFSGAKSCVYSLKWQEGSYTRASFSPDGKKIIVSSENKDVKLLSRSGKLLKILGGHKSYVYSAVFSPNGQYILTASQDKTAKLWDLNGEFIKTLDNHKGPVRSAVFSYNSQRILTGSEDKTAKLWDRNGEYITTLGGNNGHKSYVKNAVFSPNGQYVITIGRKTAKLWDRNGIFLKTISKYKNNIYSALFSPNSKNILTAGDNSANLFKKNGDLINNLDRHSWVVTNAVFSHNGQHILTGSADGTVKLWDGEGNFLTTLSTHKKYITSLVFSHDDQYILTTSTDKTAKIWDKEGNLLSTLEGHFGSVFSAEFSPDGRNILTASLGQVTRLWNFIPQVEDFVKHIREIVPRCLTPKQREKYHLSPTPPPWCYSMNKWPYKAEDAPSFWKTWNNWIWGIGSVLATVALLLFLQLTGRLTPVWQWLSPVFKRIGFYSRFFQKYVSSHSYFPAFLKSKGRIR